MFRHTVIALLAGAATQLAGAQPATETYPNKVIRVVVPFAAGSSSDVLGRVVLERMSHKLKQPIIIDNKAGAGGTIGTGFVAKAPADGYTLLLTTSSPLTINPLIDKSVTYDVRKDLMPVAVLNNIGLLLVARPDFPAKDLQELIALVKRDPGKYSFATNGSGSYSHMSMELFKKELGLELTHIPYKGAAQAETDVLGGQVSLMFDSVATGSEFVKTGRLKSFGISSANADALAPQHRPLAQQGVQQLRNFDVTAFTGLLAPAGTPQRVITILKESVIDALNDPQLRAQFAKRNIPLAESRDAFSMEQQLQADHAKWSELVKTANIKIE
ncbi:MAG: bordetella uptake protein [Polaromonas sp.]|nr:bordetella uptake protein [Polaromonas sp.]